MIFNLDSVLPSNQSESRWYSYLHKVQSKLFLWYEFWKNIFCGNSYVARGVLMTNILNNIHLANVLLLFLWHLSLELSQPLIYSGEKWNVSFTFPWTRKKWTVTIHLMNFGRLSDMSQGRLQEYYDSSDKPCQEIGLATTESHNENQLLRYLSTLWK